jgi:putative FmdB family regulatory protein
VPTYEYHCDRCGRDFEVRQRISEAALTTHEGCGGPVRRLLSAAPFILKGEGWYVTDYPSASRKKSMESEKSGDKPAAAASTDKGGSSEKSSSSDSGTTNASGSAAASTPSSSSSSS